MPWCLNKPCLLDFAVCTSAGVISDVSLWTVDGGEIWLANIQEVRSHTTHRNFGYVCERLADGTSEEKHAHLRDQKRSQD